MKKIEIRRQDELPMVARELLNAHHSDRVFAFYGEMGAGKTTLIKELCRQLGVGGTTSSPTFAIVNEYAGNDGPIYHFDFYRINSIDEAVKIGFDDYLYSGCHCFIEWPEKIDALMASEAYVKVEIEVKEDGTRVFSAENV